MLKEAMNCILENGAYSDKNYESQMTKKGNNYNDFEKDLLTLSYKLKKFRGEKLQKELFTYITNDKEFMEHLKATDIEIYEKISGMISHGS